MHRWHTDSLSPRPEGCGARLDPRSDPRVSFELHNESALAQRHSLTQQRPNGDAQQNGDQHSSEYLNWRSLYPAVLEHYSNFLQLIQGKCLAIFLDYDGTLAPIVKNPDEAFMSEEMRYAVRGTAQFFPTAIISGRGREKVEQFVQLSELYYAGSHGMDITGPEASGQSNGLRFEAAASFKPLIDQVYHELCEKLAEVPGATVEHNKFCVSAHFRNCAPDNWQRVVGAVDETVGGRKELRVTRGRKVLEVRPKVDWDKGKALLHLLEALDLAGQQDVVALYLGDDHTDEDAFRALKEQQAGLGILVSSKAKPTDAVFTVRDPAEVQQFLSQLVEYGRSAGNGWHARGSCKGWAPAAQPQAGAPRAAGAAADATQQQQQQ